MASLAVNLLISFWLSPYIIQTIGVEANGFVSLANNFITYANLIVTALNAMAARFITLSYIQQDYQRANLYYNSVFWGNMIIVAILLLPAAYLLIKLEHFIDIPANILMDVKILFSFVFILFFIRTAAPNYDCGTYITNRMDLAIIPNMATSMLRCVLLITLFTIWTPRIWYISLVSLCLGLITLIVSGYFTHKLTPELRITFSPPLCSWSAITELVGAGVWNSISSAGLMMVNSLDLLICNLYLGATSMGILSLSKTIPNILVQFVESIRGAFGPELTIIYADGDHQQLCQRIRSIMKFTCVINTVPTSGILILSDIFYQLWVPSQDTFLLRMLTSLTMFHYVFMSGTVVLYGVFTITNKVKYNSVAMLTSGLLSTAITLALLSFTDLGVIAVSGVSCIIGITRDLLFTIPATSRFLKLKWYTFYPQVGQSILCCAVVIGIGSLVRTILPINGWITFFVACGITGILGLCANMIIVLNKEERSQLIGMVMRRFLKKS